MRDLIVNKRDIHCHYFEQNGNYFVYDYYYDVTLRITKDTMRCLDNIVNNRSCDKTKIEFKFIYELIKEGLLISKYELPLENINTAYLHFAPVYGCNFKCSYCFGKYGEIYKGEQKLFEVETMKAIVLKFVNEWFDNYDYYRIDFVSGGEPLLNFDIVQETILFAEKIKKKYSKKISIWLCTNGSLLNKEICDFLDKHNVSIGVSLDGNKNNHDKCRIDKNGKGTYDIVVSKIKKILNSEKYSKKFKNVWGLSVVSKNNSNVGEIVKHNIKLGLKNIQMNLYRGDSSDLKPNEISKSYSLLCEEIFQDFQNGNTEILKSIINDNDYFGKILKRIFLHEVAFRRCLAGISNVTVCPDGEVYPCDSFVGYKEYCIGNYKSLEKIHTVFDNLNVDAREKCKSCSIRYICGGDCYYNSHINNGETSEPDKTFCEIQMCIVNCSIELKQKMEEFNPNGLKEIIRLLKIKQGYNDISQ